MHQHYCWCTQHIILRDKNILGYFFLKQMCSTPHFSSSLTRLCIQRLPISLFSRDSSSSPLLGPLCFFLRLCLLLHPLRPGLSLRCALELCFDDIEDVLCSIVDRQGKSLLPMVSLSASFFVCNVLKLIHIGI